MVMPCANVIEFTASSVGFSAATKPKERGFSPGEIAHSCRLLATASVCGLSGVSLRWRLPLSMLTIHCPLPC
ncbi:hypothetical protein D3C72_2117010 [compost metagenome]